jgi:hypothetical protein
VAEASVLYSPATADISANSLFTSQSQRAGSLVFSARLPAAAVATDAATGNRMLMSTRNRYRCCQVPLPAQSTVTRGPLPAGCDGQAGGVPRAVGVGAREGTTVRVAVAAGDRKGDELANVWVAVVFADRATVGDAVTSAILGEALASVALGDAVASATLRLALGLALRLGEG